MGLTEKQKIESGKIAKVTKEAREAVIARDKICVICASQNKVSDITDIHHVFYGPHKTEYSEIRNKPESLLGLCHSCHYIIHHGKENSQEYREFCETYINYIRKLIGLDV